MPQDEKRWLDLHSLELLAPARIFPGRDQRVIQAIAGLKGRARPVAKIDRKPVLAQKAPPGAEPHPLEWAEEVPAQELAHQSSDCSVRAWQGSACFTRPIGGLQGHGHRWRCSLIIDGARREA